MSETAGVRCDNCKYEPLPPPFDASKYPALTASMEAPPFEHFIANIKQASLRAKARAAYYKTGEVKGEHCYRCGHVFDLDDTRWQGETSALTWSGNYVRVEPRSVWSIRSEMTTRAGNGNAEAIEYLAKFEQPCTTESVK